MFCSRRLQLRSPVMIISLFSSSSSSKKFSKSLNSSMLELGGLYHVVINSGLLFSFLISIQINSKLSVMRSFRTIYGMWLLIYIATPPPLLFRSRLTISYRCLERHEIGTTNQIRRSYKNDQSIISRLYYCVPWNYNQGVAKR